MLSAVPFLRLKRVSFIRASLERTCARLIFLIGASSCAFQKIIRTAPPMSACLRWYNSFFMLNLRRVLIGFLLGSALLAATSYKVVKSIPIGGEGGWDYLTADSQNRRLYVSHGTEVDVLDLDTEAKVGKIPNTNGVHGIAIADDLNRGFVSDGRDNQVTIFDLKTLAVISTVKAGTNPDGIVYDPFSQRVFAFNGRSKDMTAIDASYRKRRRNSTSGRQAGVPGNGCSGQHLRKYRG